MGDKFRDIVAILEGDSRYHLPDRQRALDYLIRNSFFDTVKEVCHWTSHYADELREQALRGIVCYASLHVQERDLPPPLEKDYRRIHDPKVLKQRAKTFLMDVATSSRYFEKTKRIALEGLVMSGDRVLIKRLAFDYELPKWMQDLAKDNFF